ncbi:hypothetical protein [Mesorhizobium sp.]|nr:hypothetical protein [Mesorhizobium sp.]
MKTLTDAEKLTILRAQLLLSSRQIGKSELIRELIRHQLQQFQNNPPQG